MHETQFPIAAPGDMQPFDHARRWLKHVEQGRIGTGPQTCVKQALRHQRNEAAFRRAAEAHRVGGCDTAGRGDLA